MSTAEQHISELSASEHANPNRLMQALLIAAIAASGISMIFSIGTAVVSAGQQPAAGVAASE